MSKQSITFSNPPRGIIGGLLFILLFLPGNLFAEDFPMHKGLNISGWLSQANRTEKAREAWFTQQELNNLRAMGFDHIRLPVAENQMFTKEGTDSLKTWQLVYNCLEWCKEAGMTCIFDYHVLNNEPALWSSNAAQDKLVAQWRTFADKLKDYPNDLVAFELLNEPVATTNSQWNTLAAKIVAAIRETQPERKLIIGSNKWNNVNQFASLTVPANDPNIILNFHFYIPHPLTHYGAEWLDIGKIEADMNYPGELITDEEYNKLTQSEKNQLSSYRGYYDFTKLKSLINLAVVRAKELGGLQLYCGEFGAYKCKRESKLAWLTDVVDILNGYGIAHSHWEYKQGFSFCDQWGNVTDKEVRDIITSDGELFPTYEEEEVDAPFYDTFENLASEWQSQDASNVTCSVVENPLLNESNPSLQVLQIKKNAVNWPAVQRGITPSVEIGNEEGNFKYLHMTALNPDGISMRIKLYNSRNTEFWYEYTPEADDSWQKVVLRISSAQTSDGKGVADKINKIAIRPNEVGTVYIDNLYLSVTDKGQTGIDNIIPPLEAEGRIYTLDGVFVGTDIDALPKGIYIYGRRTFIKK